MSCFFDADLNGKTINETPCTEDNCSSNTIKQDHDGEYSHEDSTGNLYVIDESNNEINDPCQFLPIYSFGNGSSTSNFSDSNEDSSLAFLAYNPLINSSTETGQMSSSYVDGKRDDKDMEMQRRL